MALQKTVLGLLLMIACAGYAQEKTGTVPAAPAQPEALTKPQEPAKATEEKKWYDRITLRGYMQVRYNNLFNTNEDLGCEQCDKAWGGTGGISLRRARVNILGQVYKNIYFKLEVDFANAVSGTQNYAQVRDAYFDVGLDSQNEYWIRIGQSKVPYGFEILQSSQNRLTLDRSDAINSAFVNERDLGAVFYWAPKEIRQLYRDLTSQNYKGSGDFGVVGIGVFNGQSANKPEMNNSQHIVARVSYPFKIGKNQIIEPGIQAYNGKYVMTQLSEGVVNTSPDLNYTDQRVGASFVLYPRPFGIQAEYNIGKGPEFDVATQSIKEKDLSGGYATFSYRIEHKDQFIFPFARYQYYKGGKKFETDARSYGVNQVDLGLEWQFNKYFKMTADYVIADRRYEDYSLQDNHQKGNTLRLQAQVNF